MEVQEAAVSILSTTVQAARGAVERANAAPAAGRRARLGARRCHLELSAAAQALAGSP